MGLGRDEDKMENGSGGGGGFFESFKVTWHSWEKAWGNSYTVIDAHNAVSNQFELNVKLKQRTFHYLSVVPSWLYRLLSVWWCP